MAKLTKNVYGVETQVPSANLNALQDEAINRPTRVPAGMGYLTAGSAVTLNSALRIQLNGDFTSVWTVPIIAKPGTRIIAVRARVTDAAGGQITMGLHRATDGVLGGPITQVLSNTLGAVQDLVMIGQTEDMPEVGVQLGEVLIVQFTDSTVSPNFIHTVEWDTDLVP